MKKSVFIITLFFLFALSGTIAFGETAGSKSKKLDKKSILFPNIPPKVKPAKPEQEAFEVEKKSIFEKKKKEKELPEETRMSPLERKHMKEEEQKLDEAQGRFE